MFQKKNIKLAYAAVSFEMFASVARECLWNQSTLNDICQSHQKKKQQNGITHNAFNDDSEEMHAFTGNLRLTKPLCWSMAPPILDSDPMT